MSMDALPSWPVFETDELRAVEDVLRSGRVNYWTGTACRDFEAAWARCHGGLRSLSMANGSLTMDAAIRALGIGPGDEVIVAPRSYVASAMCVVLAGATPVFADVDPDSGCITPESAEAVRSSRTRAVIPVHIGGWPCDMPGFVEWSRTHGIQVIEDCAQSHGGHIAGKPLGTFGTFASWSFCQDKIMTTGGEGGMLSTADEELYKAGFVMDALATDGATRGGTYNSLAVAAAAAAGVVTLASARSKEAAYSLLSACMRRNVTSKIPMFACIDGR